MRFSLILLMFFYSCLAFAKAHVQDLRIWPSPDSTRIVFDLDKTVKYQTMHLSNPARFVVDIKSAAAAKPTNKAVSSSNVLNKIRAATRNQSDLRVVFDLKVSAKANAFLLPPNDKYGHRLVVDLVPKGKKSKPIATNIPKKYRDIIVAIDAGHGGEDPGAIGPRGTQEKTVVLAMARELAKLVEKEPGMRPVLIRTGDYYVSLRGRIQKARDKKADLFVSLHADSFTNSKARGSSVYVLSTRGASSETAKWLAQKENSSDLIGGVGAVSLKDKDKTLASVLLDLSMTATRDASQVLAGSVLGNIKRINKLHKSDVEQAGFVVLKSPDIPSILVETAFISNSREEAKLRQKKFQRKMASSVMRGIKQYFHKYPPPGTKLARRTHTVQRGDNLSEIAEAYGVTVAYLKRSNQLSSDTLQIGQKLLIPRS